MSQDDVVIRLRLAEVAKFVADGKAANLTNAEIEKGIRKLGVTAKAESHEYGGLGLWGATVGRIKYAIAGLALGLGAGAVAVAKFGITSIAQFQQIEVAYTNMLGSGAGAQKLITQLEQFASVTPFMFGGQDGMAHLTQQMMGVGYASKDVIPILTAVGDAVAAIGGSSTEASTVVQDLMTLKGAGKLTGDVIRDMSHHGINVRKYLEDQLSLTPTALEKLVSQGKISADTAIAAIVRGVESGPAKGMMAVESQTLSGLWSTMKDDLIFFAVKVMKPYLPGMTSMLKAFTGVLGDPETAVKVQHFFDKLIQGGIGIYNTLTSRGVVRLLGDLWKAVEWMFDATLRSGQGVMDLLRAIMSPFEQTSGKSNAEVLSDFANAVARFLENPVVQNGAKLLFDYKAAIWGIQAAAWAASGAMNAMGVSASALGLEGAATAGGAAAGASKLGPAAGAMTVAGVAGDAAAKDFDKKHTWWGDAAAYMTGGGIIHEMGGYSGLWDKMKGAGSWVKQAYVGDPLPKTPAAKVPGQASGGITTAAGWSMTGENGPELQYMPRGATVIPLPRVADFSTSASAANQRRPVILVADGVQIARVVDHANDTMAARL